MGNTHTQRHDDKQGARLRVGGQHGHHQQAAQHGAADTCVAPLQCLRQVAAHDHHDGGEDPVFVRRPRQVQRHDVAGSHGQRGAQCVAQHGRAPAELAGQRGQRPAGGADKQLPLRAHRRQFGRGVAPCQRGQFDGLIVDVANAVGHVVQQRGGVGCFQRQRLGALCGVGRGARWQHTGEVGALVGDGLDGVELSAQQQ